MYLVADIKPTMRFPKWMDTAEQLLYVICSRRWEETHRFINEARYLEGPHSSKYQSQLYRGGPTRFKVLSYEILCINCLMCLQSNQHAICPPGALYFFPSFILSFSLLFYFFIFYNMHNETRSGWCEPKLNLGIW